MQEPQEDYHPFCCGKVVIKQGETVSSFVSSLQNSSTLLIDLENNHSDCSSRSGNQDGYKCCFYDLS